MAKVIVHPAVAQYEPSGVGQNAPVDRQSIYTERSKQTDVEALHEQTEERVKQGQELDWGFIVIGRGTSGMTVVRPLA